MMRSLSALVCAALTLACRAQNSGSGLASILNFEAQHTGGRPSGWNVSPPGSVSVDDKIVHGGQWSARIERREGAAGSISGFNKSLAMDLAGATIVLRGFLRTEDVIGYVGFWMREDGDSPRLAFDDMQR